MRYLKLPATELTVSCLGFGSSHLMGCGSKSDALHLLQTALDGGITHFDTARMYGYGAAEGAIGQFLKGRRSQVTITTKVGIAPPEQSFLVRKIRPALRRIALLLPQARIAMRKRAHASVQKGQFNIEFVRRSVETSLRELRTDYVDMLLLHEPETKDLLPELLELLERLKQEGKTKYFGIASSLEICSEAARFAPGFCNILQFPSRIWSNNAIRERQPNDSGVITHSALREKIGELRQILEARPHLLEKWSRILEFDCSEPGAIPLLALKYACAINQSGVVLFSSSSPANILSNARFADDKRPDPIKLQQFFMSIDTHQPQLALDSVPA